MKLLRRLFHHEPKEGTTSWQEVRACPEHYKDHVCRERGPHYQHTCLKEDCQFRWAK